MELVVMAAGMGSRFGGLKQIEPVGPNGEFILDYSIYDAMQNGFDKVVLIIKEEHLNDFKETIGKRLEGKIQVEYAFQKNSTLPSGFEVPSDRVKPLGTGHALYCTKEYVDGPLAVISADDFYGGDAFKVLGDSLKNTEDYSVIGYHIGNTIPENNSVKRGVCFTQDGKLTDIIESKVERIDGVIHGEPLDGREPYTMEEDHPVSMLMYGLRKDIYDYMEKDFKEFLGSGPDLNTCEYFLPTVLDHMMKEGLEIKVLPTKALWKGVTYKEDLEELKEHIRKAIENGEYPENLWG